MGFEEHRVGLRGVRKGIEGSQRWLPQGQRGEEGARLRGVIEGEDTCEVTPIGGFAIEVDTLAGHIQRTFQANGVPKDIRDRLWRVAVITDFGQ